MQLFFLNYSLNHNIFDTVTSWNFALILYILSNTYFKIINNHHLDYSFLQEYLNNPEKLRDIC